MAKIGRFRSLGRQRGRAVQPGLVALGGALAQAAPLEHRDGQRQRLVVPLLADGEASRDRGFVDVVAHADAQITLRDFGCFFQDDVDRSGYCLGTLVGGRSFGNLNALHLRGIELIQLETGRCWIAIEQNQGVA